MEFLHRALKLASTSVYSLHKSSTRQHIKKKAAEWGAEMTVVAGKINSPKICIYLCTTLAAYLSKHTVLV